jgi:cell division protein FtsW
VIHRKSVYLLVISVAAMLALGIVMLFSTSAFAQDSHGDPVYFVKRQSMWLAIGVIVCITASVVDYHFWQRTWWIWFSVAILLLALCFVPPIGMRINGSWRWVRLGPINFQPSELGKLAVITFLAFWFSKQIQDAAKFWKGFLLPMGVVGALAALIACEVDLGTTALIGGTMVILMFVAGTNLWYLGSMALMGLAGLGFAIKNMPERSGRFLAFLHPEQYPADAYQGLQGLIALGSGGVSGLGLGNGRQKMSYLPFAHTDFIFPMIGEELGLRCTLLVVFCYIVIIVCGTIISMHSRDRFGMLLGFGIVSMIALQAAVNIGVTTTLLPNKGLPLPFISYGGSNLVFCLLGIGILINIYRQGVAGNPERAMTKLRVKATPRI